MSTRLIASWTIKIPLGGVFSSPLEFRDEDGTVIPYTDPQIVFTPNDGTPVTWSIGNGQIAFVSTGIYTIFVDTAEIATYDWTSGRYHLSVVDGSSNPIPCLTSGLAFVVEC